jgi:hypothetical protein
MVERIKIVVINPQNEILEDKNISFETLTNPTVLELKKQVEDLSKYEVISESFMENAVERSDDYTITRQGFLKYTIHVK